MLETTPTLLFTIEAHGRLVYGPIKTTADALAEKLRTIGKFSDDEVEQVLHEIDNLGSVEVKPDEGKHETITISKILAS
ncbi:hypothetical protein [Phyllobacterium chamaecytisi]|uniref:hypothetical protein n=1 Tax=Phyllobacterium chamaecytisi TaxID=2876082 RepID=UPI001CCC9D94|nr:hypothetical protein [Phyllobacterium sp. KW56]MBZ9604307.1 hypothetical protein [Phyllobacterium sp. KW56]